MTRLFILAAIAAIAIAACGGLDPAVGALFCDGPCPPLPPAIVDGGSGGCASPSDCPAMECEIPTCTPGVCGVQPKPLGDPCSGGLCKNSACVAHIPVICTALGQRYTDCDGRSHAWVVQRQITPNTSVPCAPPTDVGYCIPGSVCWVTGIGGVLQGTCQNAP